MVVIVTVSYLVSILKREVKPAYADGTAMKCGRVGSR